MKKHFSNYILGLALSLFTLMGFSLAQAAGTPVTSVVISGQPVMADSAHLTVYTFDRDLPNESNCYNGCAKKWPPVIGIENETQQENFGVIKRNDGLIQLTYKNQPIYYFADDKVESDALGDGLGGVWHVIPYQGN